MTRTTCDICGKEMPHTKLDTIENLNFCMSSHGKIWDICSECRVSLNRWMTRRRNGWDEEEDLQNRLDIAEYDKERLIEKISNLEKAIEILDKLIEKEGAE